MVFLQHFTDRQMNLSASATCRKQGFPGRKLFRGSMSIKNGSQPHLFLRYLPPARLLVPLTHRSAPTASISSPRRSHSSTTASATSTATTCCGSGGGGDCGASTTAAPPTTAASPTSCCGHGCYCCCWGGVCGSGGLVIGPGEGRAPLAPLPGAVVEVSALVGPLASNDKVKGVGRGYHVRQGIDDDIRFRFLVCGWPGVRMSVRAGSSLTRRRRT